VARAPVTAEDLAALQTDVLAGYVFAQAVAGAGKAWQEAADRGSRASSRLAASHLGPTRTVAAGLVENSPDSFHVEDLIDLLVPQMEECRSLPRG
jgi:hypothetical protein